MKLRTVTAPPSRGGATSIIFGTREAEIAVLAATAEIGAAFVASSPVARGFLADAVHSSGALAANDLRRQLPRFSDDNLPANLVLLDRFRSIADVAGVTPAQLAIGWGLAKAPHIVSIPGTTQIVHLSENFVGRTTPLDLATLAEVDAVMDQATVRGLRYPPATLLEIDTEQFPVP